MTDLSYLLKLISDLKSSLQTLQQQGTAVLQIVRGDLQQQINRAQAFANALGPQFTATGANRVDALQAEIDADKAVLNGETDPLNRMIIGRHIANLELLAGAAGLNAALSAIVVFTPDEVTEIRSLLTQAQSDIDNRHDLASAVRIFAAVITSVAQIAGKVAAFGL